MTDATDLTAWMDEQPLPVPCNGCRLCCIAQLVLLFPDRGDDPASYQTRRLDTPKGPVEVLDHKPNGECVYLGEAGCTIYDLSLIHI